MKTIKFLNVLGKYKKINNGDYIILSINKHRKVNKEYKQLLKLKRNVFLTSKCMNRRDKRKKDMDMKTKIVQ